jgi:hypothetical protein
VKDEPDISRRALLKAAGLALATSGYSFPLPARLSDPHAAATRRKVDFRYRPPWWQTAICLPDDPDKVLVGKEGQLLFDWGVLLDKQGKSFVADATGGVELFGIVLQPEFKTGAKWDRQETLSARVPIVETWRSAQGLEIRERAFVATTRAREPARTPLLTRVDFPGFMAYGWAKPRIASSPAFNDAAVGLSDSDIRFQAAVPTGATVTLIFGLCDGTCTEPGQRVLVLGADGSESRTVDPINDFGSNQPGVYRLTARDTDKDGIINISVGSAGGDAKYQPILSALWVFSEEVPRDADIVSGRADHTAWSCFPSVLQPPRRTILLVTLRNTTSEPATCQPMLRVVSRYPVTFNERRHDVRINGRTRISASGRLALVPSGVQNETIIQSSPIELSPGASQDFAIVIDRSFETSEQLDTDQAGRLLAVTRQWWEEYDLPYTVVTVPDPDIQAMLESCIRNIWQARELKIGGPAFQVGPTCYRGLYIVDGSFLLESTAILGRGLDARSGIEYLLSQQKPDGRFEVLQRYWKENGIVIWAATRHAFLTQDKAWLQSHWAALQSAMAAIVRLRAEASVDPQTLNYRLLPGGYVDGGIDNMKEAEPEYSNTYWSLTGMKAFIAAAQWLGDTASAASAQKEYADFYDAFRHASARDMTHDRRGNPYLPIMMANAKDYAPPKGQWSFCHAVYPGQIFAKDDPLVEGQLAMLHACTVEDMVCDTGWMASGIWTYFASFYGHALLWQGRSREAAQSLYAFAQHACPTRVWREEQRPTNAARGVRDMNSVGDMPHNWASAEFIRLTTHLIELDRGDELHLLEGFPSEWAAAGMVTRLNGVLTPFGPLHLELRIADDGRSADFRLRKLRGTPPSRIFLHLRALTGKEGVLELATDHDAYEHIRIARI